MHSFIKRNQKKFLAIFSAGLMIAFMLPAAMKSGNDRRVVTAGYAGKTKVTNKDIAESHAQWELLKRTVRVKRMNQRGEEVEVPVLQDQLGEGFERLGPQVGAMASRNLDQIDANPELFYLLVREAEDMGTSVSNDQMQGLIKNASFTPDDQADYQDRVQDAIHSLLLVRNTADRAADLVKISQPQREQSLARTQQISVNLVPFKAADYVAKLPAWTEQEQAAKVKAQYERYKNETPTTRPTNEFGFGYRVPNQSQVQYIELPGEAIRKMVTEKITDLDARKYFYQNRGQFPAEPSTQPAPATQAAGATQPTTLASSQPTTQPHEPTFEEVEKKVYDRLTEQRVSAVTNEILADLTSQMTADYVAFKAAVSDSAAGPTTATSMPTASLAKAPVTSLGVPYNNYEYLQKLALNTQKKFGVLPKTNQDLGPRTEKQLSIAGDIAYSKMTGFDIYSLLQRANGNFQAVQEFMQQIGPRTQYPAYVTNYVAPLASPALQQDARNYRLRVLSLFEPSPIFEGRSTALSLGSTNATNNYIFRVIAAVPAHAPALSDVITQVTADAKLVEAQNLALAAAKDFLKGIPAPYPHLSAAADAGGKKVTTTGLFSRGRPMIENFLLPPGESTGLFINGAYQLLNSPLGDRQHPVGVIDFKPQATVYAAEINQIQPFWAPGDLPTEQVTLGADEDQQTGIALKLQWFNPQDIRARTHYVPVQQPKPSRSDEDSDAPPINPLGALVP